MKAVFEQFNDESGFYITKLQLFLPPIVKKRMKRLAVIWFLSFALMASMVVPAVLTIVNFDYSTTALLDTSKGNSQNNQTTFFEEDIKTVQTRESVTGLYTIQKNKVFNHYLEDISIFTSRITVPPPKFFI